MYIIDNLAKEPAFCVILSAVLFLASFLGDYFILDALLKMHRSKTAVKKLKKEYSFVQKMWLLPFFDHCLHAIKFCKFLVWVQRFHMFCFTVYVLIVLLFCFGLLPSVILAWIVAGLFIFFELPSLFISTAFSRPLIGRFKKYSFEKYHNTNNHNSLL